MAILKNKQIPRIPGLPILGSSLEYVKNPIDFYKKVEEKYPDVSVFALANLKLLCTFNPDDIKHILVDNADNYNKSTAYTKVRDAIGHGILTVGHKDWVQRRKIGNLSFTRPMLQTYGAEMSRIIHDGAVKLSEKYATGEVFSLFREMNSIALEIASATMFGTRLFKHSERLSDNLSKLMLLVEQQISSITFPLWVPTPFNIRFRKVQKVLLNDISEILNEAREKFNSGEEVPSLVKSLLEQDKKTDTIDKWNIQEEAITYLVAGHETTGSALTWAWYLISQHPEVEQRFESELKKVLGGRSAQFEDIPNLVYTAQIAQETLRLYPSIWVLGRSNILKDELSGYEIEPNTDIAIVPYVMHRNPKYWVDPEKFDPDRFSPENEKNINKYHYLPFAAGPRNCIGHKFALNEMVLVLATFAQFFRFRLKEGFIPFTEVLVAMRPGAGMPMKIVDKKKQ